MAKPITATINYAARTPFRQSYYANDHARDTVVVAGQAMPLADARADGATLAAEGFELVPHVSAVRDFEDTAEVARLHPGEIEALVQRLTGADLVRVTAPGIVRFAEASGRAGSRNNSMPARFAHVDVTAQTAARMVARGVTDGRTVTRAAQYNVWRAFSGAPQDVPLAVCDARSVPAASLLVADAIFDEPGKPAWSFESWLVTHDPAHRWCWFPDMTRDEALIFRTSDSALGQPVPHVAFDNPLAPAGCTPRASIEMRVAAYWFA